MEDVGEVGVLMQVDPGCFGRGLTGHEGSGRDEPEACPTRHTWDSVAGRGGIGWGRVGQFGPMWAGGRRVGEPDPDGGGGIGDLADPKAGGLVYRWLAEGNGGWKEWEESGAEQKGDRMPIHDRLLPGWVNGDRKGADPPGW